MVANSFHVKYDTCPCWQDDETTLEEEEELAKRDLGSGDPEDEVGAYIGLCAGFLFSCCILISKSLTGTFTVPNPQQHWCLVDRVAAEGK